MEESKQIQETSKNKLHRSTSSTQVNGTNESRGVHTILYHLHPSNTKSMSMVHIYPNKEGRRKQKMKQRKMLKKQNERTTTITTMNKHAPRAQAESWEGKVVVCWYDLFHVMSRYWTNRRTTQKYQLKDRKRTRYGGQLAMRLVPHVLLTSC